MRKLSGCSNGRHCLHYVVLSNVSSRAAGTTWLSYSKTPSTQWLLFSCRLPVMLLVGHNLFLSLSWSSLYFWCHQRSDVKLFQQGRGGLTTQHELERGVYQHTSKITSDHDEHPADHKASPSAGLMMKWSPLLWSRPNYLHWTAEDLCADDGGREFLSHLFLNGSDGVDNLSSQPLPSLTISCLCYLQIVINIQHFSKFMRGHRSASPLNFRKLYPPLSFRKTQSGKRQHFSGKHGRGRVQTHASCDGRKHCRFIHLKDAGPDTKTTGRAPVLFMYPRCQCRGRR